MILDRFGRLEAPVLVPVLKPTIGLRWHRQIIEALKSRKYILRDNWFFMDSHGNLCMIPAGQHEACQGVYLDMNYQFATDGTSWPRLVQMFFDKMGIGLRSALTHDFAMRYRVFLDPSGGVMREFETRAEVDEEYRLIDILVNDMEWWSWIKWMGVRIGGWLAWKTYRGMPHQDTDPKLLLKNVAVIDNG